MAPPPPPPLPQRSSLRRCLVRAAAVAVLAACGGDVTPPRDVLLLEGTVRNGNNGLPIERAVVFSGSYAGNSFVSRRLSSTDAEGRYAIDDECQGNDYLKAQAPGYGDILGPVDCAPTRRTLDISLMPVFNP